MRKEMFQTYLQANPDLQGYELVVLRRLQTDDRMADIWTSFGSFSPHILAMIMSCYRRACMVARKTEMMREISEQFDHLRAAEESLNKHFSAFLRTPNPGMKAHIDQRNADFREAVTWLDRMRSWLNEEEQANCHFLNRFSPMSQKNSDPINAFSVMLCNDFTDLLSQPFYDRTALIVDVVYETDEASTVDNIRMRLARDRKARVTAGLPSWGSRE